MQFCYSPSAIEVTLKDMVKTNRDKPQPNANRVRISFWL